MTTEQKQGDAPLTKVLSMFESLSNDLHANSDRLIVVERKLDNILAAFPSSNDGGLVGHLMYHIKKNAECREAKETRAMLKRNILLWGTSAVLGVIGLGVWLVFLSKLPHS